MNDRVGELRAMVQSLQEQIEEIQRACHHQYRKNCERNWLESKVNGIYFSETFTLYCTECGYVTWLKTSEMCPQCMTHMHRGSELEEWEQYSGRKVELPAIVSYCHNCGFKVCAPIFPRNS